MMTLLPSFMKWDMLSMAVSTPLLLPSIDKLIPISAVLSKTKYGRFRKSSCKALTRPECPNLYVRCASQTAQVLPETLSKPRLKCLVS